MAVKQIFINLPVCDVDAALEFYIQLGFTVNPLFTFDDQKCMMWDENIFVMLQTFEMAGGANATQLSDNATFTLPVESVAAMNELMARGLAAGGTEETPLIDEGFMQVRTLTDLDNHRWGIVFIDMPKFKAITGK